MPTYRHRSIRFASAGSEKAAIFCGTCSNSPCCCHIVCQRRVRESSNSSAAHAASVGSMLLSRCLPAVHATSGDNNCKLCTHWSNCHHKTKALQAIVGTGRHTRSMTVLITWKLCTSIKDAAHRHVMLSNWHHKIWRKLANCEACREQATYC